MDDILWHVTAEQTSGWPDAPHTRKGSPGEEGSLGYPVQGFSGLHCCRQAAFYSEFFSLILVKFNSFGGEIRRKKDEKELENSSFLLISSGQHWLLAN